MQFRNLFLPAVVSMELPTTKAAIRKPLKVAEKSEDRIKESDEEHAPGLPFEVGLWFDSPFGKW